MRTLQVFLLSVAVSLSSSCLTGLRYVPPPCEVCTARELQGPSLSSSRSFFQKKRKCCPSSTAKITVVSAVDNSPLAGATVTTTSARNSPYTTDASGVVEIEINEKLPYTLTYSVTKAGYITVMRSEVFNAAGITRNIIVPMRGERVDRVELHWGSTPRDLDLYVVEYDDAGATCQTYYGNQAGCPETSLARDFVNGNGPEITTWSGNSKKYLIFARQYTSTTPYLVNSQAQLKLYGQGGSEQIYSVATTPAGNTDRNWVLGCFDGALGLPSLNLLNSFVSDGFTSDTFADPSICTPLGSRHSSKIQGWEFYPGPKKTYSKKQLKKQHKKYNKKQKYQKQ